MLCYVMLCYVMLCYVIEGRSKLRRLRKSEGGSALLHTMRASGGATPLILTLVALTPRVSLCFYCMGGWVASGTVHITECLALSTIPWSSSPCLVTISTEISRLQILYVFFLDGTWRWAVSRNCLASDCKRFLWYRHKTSSFGIATRYGLDGPGIESRWGARISAVGHGAHPSSCTMGTGTFSGAKLPERVVDHPPHLARRLKKE
jgi:hypothetical protein